MKRKGASSHTNTLIELFGWYGTAAIISAYALTSFSILASDDLLYQLLNITGSLGIIVLSLQKKVYQSAVLNIIWAIIAGIAIIKILS